MRRFYSRTLRVLGLAMLTAVMTVKPLQASADDATTVATTWQGSDPQTYASGQRFYIYNVAAGKFIMASGLWNTEAMLRLQDYGMPFVLQIQTVGDITDGSHDTQTVSAQQYVLQTGMSSTNNASYGGCNVAGWTTSSSGTTLYNVILDASAKGMVGNYYYYRSVAVVPVEGTTDFAVREDIYRFTKGNAASPEKSSYYLYAASTNADGSNGTDGPLDHVAYTSTTTKSEVTKDDLPYLWRCVLPDELRKAVDAQNGDNNGGAYGGLSANVTYLLHDPYFDRAQTDFSTYTETTGTTTSSHNTWTVKASSNVSSTVDNDQNSPRFDWTAQDHQRSDRRALFDPLTSDLSGNDKNVPSNTVHTFTIIPEDIPYTANTNLGVLDGDAKTGIYRQPWNGPVFRKLEAADNEWPGTDYKMRNIQYEMGTLEGEGEAYQTVSFTTPGRYTLTAHAFAVGSNTEGTLFVRPANGGNSVSVNLTVVTPAATLWTDGGKRSGNNPKSNWVNIYNSNQQNWSVVAKQLDETNPVTLQFNVPEGASANNPVQYQIGISKAGSSRSDNPLFDATRKYLDTDTGNGSSYLFYSDKNYVAIDNMQLHYLGTQEPFLFDELAKEVTYMSSKLGTGFNNRTTYLRREAAINKWQPIILPVSLTTEQVRQAFGEETKLGKLEGVGKSDDRHSPTSIDFTSVDLKPGQTAIEAWQYYLIYATREPSNISWNVTTTNDDGTSTTTVTSGKAYNLGRLNYNPTSITRTFNNNGTDEQQTKSISDDPNFSDVIYGSKWSGTVDPFEGGKNDLQVHGTWIRQEHIAPAGAYYVSNGDMYDLQNAQTVRGFKWWITASAETKAKGLQFNFIDPGQSPVTFIDGVTVDRKDAGRDNAVYNLAGQRVADDASALSTLPSGIYITGGKKIINR